MNRLFRIHSESVSTEQSVAQTELDATTGIFGLGDLLSGFLPEPGPTDHCPNCGWTLKDFDEAGGLGCSLCYSVFSVPIRLRIRPEDSVS